MPACPHCAEEIKEQAKVCPHCTRDVTNPSMQRIDELPNSPTVGEAQAIIQDLGIEGAADHYGMRYVALTSIIKQYNLITNPNAAPIKPISPGPAPQPNANQGKPNVVVVGDINMSFWSMVEFMVKWAIASIPAIIILTIIISICFGILAGMLGIGG